MTTTEVPTIAIESKAAESDYHLGYVHGVRAAADPLTGVTTMQHYAPDANVRYVSHREPSAYESLSAEERAILDANIEETMRLNRDDVTPCPVDCDNQGHCGWNHNWDFTRDCRTHTQKIFDGIVVEQHERADGEDCTEETSPRVTIEEWTILTAAEAIEFVAAVQRAAAIAFPNYQP